MAIDLLIPVDQQIVGLMSKLYSEYLIVTV